MENFMKKLFGSPKPAEVPYEQRAKRVVEAIPLVDPAAGGDGRNAELWRTYANRWPDLGGQEIEAMIARTKGDIGAVTPELVQEMEEQQRRKDSEDGIL